MGSTMTNVAKNKVIAAETRNFLPLNGSDFLVLFPKCEAELIPLNEKVSRVPEICGELEVSQERYLSFY